MIRVVPAKCPHCYSRMSCVMDADSKVQRYTTRCPYCTTRWRVRVDVFSATRMQIQFEEPAHDPMRDN
jgi:transcription elongation factor Elf1